MAYNALNNLIDAYIYANGVQAITGQILNGVLKQMVSQLGSGYHLMGVAGPETAPASNDYAMAYFAATAGEYTDFGGITLAAGEVAVLLTSGNGSWSKQTIYNVPTGTADLENTAEFITNAVTDLVNYYTKTEVDTTLADYPTLAALATALADYYTKTEIDGQMGDVDTALADRYTKSETDTKLGDYYKKTETYDKDEVDSIVASLSRQEYIVAWDGTSAPDVSAIPAGVTVTYSGTTYTGTLAASASTVNKIYMVWNGVAYDMYGTSQDGGYSWVPMGTTTVDLSQYATKTEVSQLEAKVTELDQIEPISLYTGHPARLERLFDAADIFGAERLFYNFDATAGYTGYVELMDSNDTRLSFIGKGSSGSGDLHYEGYEEIPVGFSYARYVTNSTTLTDNTINLMAVYPSSAYWGSIKNTKYIVSQNEIAISALSGKIGFFKCETPGATAAKSVTATGFMMPERGGAVKLLFSYANSAANPTLSINGTTAKTIVFNGVEASPTNTWANDTVVEFYYDPYYNSNAGAWVGRSIDFDCTPSAGSRNMVESGGVFGAVRNVRQQSKIVTASDFGMLSVDIKNGTPYKIRVNVTGIFSRLILNYNENSNKRLFDSADVGDFSNKDYRLVAAEDITAFGLYITGDCQCSISLINVGIEDKYDDIFGGDNILFNRDVQFVKNNYYNTGGVPNTSYSYFIIPVTSGTTYYFNPSCRFLSKEGQNIYGEKTGPFSYTADFTGNLYVTFFNNTKNWIVTTKTSFAGIIGYNFFTNANIVNERGNSSIDFLSPIGAKDAIAEYLYGARNLIATGEFRDNYYHNGDYVASNSYQVYKVALTADTEYMVSGGLRYLSTDGSLIGNYGNITNAYMTFTPSANGNYYFTFAKSCNAFFVGEKSKFKFPDVLFAKKWVSCGDSFTQGDFTGASGSTTFSDMPFEGKRKVYPFFVGRRCGMEVVNEAISGSTMAYVDGNRNEFSTPNGRYTQIPDDADYITLWFGINDSHQNVPIGTISDNVNTTFYGAWNIVMSYILEHHPNAKIGIIISNGCDTTAYPIATRAIARKWGVSYLDLNGDYKVPLMLRVNEKTEVDATVLQDILERQSVNYPSNQHPNVAAHEYESTFIEEWLRSL